MFPMDEKPRIRGERAVAFLLAQVGAQAAGRFAERLAPLGLKPSDAGIIRLLESSAGMSQQDLASSLRIHPSRLVAVVDDLEGRGLVKRLENVEDRRTYALHLTAKGRAKSADLGRIAQEHNEALCEGLKPEERATLAELLSRIAVHEGLTLGVHPGYRHMGGGRAARPDAGRQGREARTKTKAG